MGITGTNIRLKKRIGKEIVCILLSLGIVLTSVDFTVLAQEGQANVQEKSETAVSENIEENQETVEEGKLSEEEVSDGDISGSEGDNSEIGEEKKEEKNPEEEEIPEESGNPDNGMDDESEKPEEDPLDGQDDGSEKESGIGQENQEETEQEDESVELTEEELVEDSGKCGDNLTWTLKDGTLTISGTGAMWDYSYYTNKSPSTWKEAKCLILDRGITSIGSSAFHGCSGFTGGLTIPEGVTSIGWSAFEGCSGFTGGLTIPEGVTIIWWSAFSGCSGFTGGLTIPERVTIIGEYAFSDCSGFTGGLTIPEGVTSIEKSAFKGCSGLNGNIYIPESVSDIRSYAFDGIANRIIYGTPGSYAETYANENNIPFVPYNFNGPENSGIELANCANIYIVDANLNIPVVGALVNNIAADANGHVALPVAEGGEDKYIGVTADGYIAYMSVRSVVPNGTYYISLNPTDGEFAVVYAKATIGGTVTNLLADKIYLQHTEENVSALSEKIMMEIEAAARGDVKSYALLQGDKVIASSMDGKFSIPILSRNGSNSLTNLEAQQSITLRATDVDEKIAAKRIGIYVSPEGAVDIKEQDKSGSLSIGSDISVTLPDSIPFLGGASASYGLKNPLPFELKVERNGQVKIAINKSASEGMEAFKEDYNKLSERAKNLSNAASTFGGTPQSFGAGYFSANVSAKGYGEGYIDMSKPGTFEIKVGVILSGKGSGKYTQYFMAGAVPFYVSIEAGASISGAATLSVKCGNSHIQSEGGVGTLSGKIYLTPKAAIGIEGIINVGISGTGACNYTWKPKDDYTKVWLTAYLELEAECFGWELNLWKSPEASYTIYESPGANAASAQAFYDSMTARIYDSNAYTIMDRSYQKKGIEGTRTTFGIGINDGSDSSIQSYVYPGADPKLVTAGNKFYLFWLQDIPGRSSENRAAVVYASSDDGANFTAPQQLLAESENQTLDNGIDVYADNGKIYVCWQDASKSFSSGMSLNEVAQSQMISYAVIDASTGNVLSHETVTETAGCYLQPKIYVTNGQPQIAWIRNSMTSADGIWGADNQETLQKYDCATGVTETLSIGDGKEKIVSMDGAVGSSQAGVVYALDTDGNLKTISDRIIYYDTRLGSGGSRTALTSGAGMYNNPVSEGGSIYWYSNGNISYTTIGSNAVASIYEEERADIGSNFQVLSEGDQTEILWNAIEYETEKVALYGIHFSGNGQWTSPYVIEQTDSEMTGAVSGSLHNGIPYISYLHIQNMDDGSKCHSLCVTQKKNVTDTVLNYAGYEYEELEPGQTLPITVELTNKGNTVVENVEMKIDGASVGTENVNLGAGETGTFVLNQYTVPEGISSYSEHTLTVTAVSEDNVSDNDYILGIGYTEIKVLCSQRLQYEGTWLDISVLNDSDIASDVTLNIRADKEDGEILYTEDLGTIEGRKGVSMTVNLRKYEDSCCTYFVEAVSGTEDVVEGNNLVFVYTGFGTDIPGGTLVPDPKIYTVAFQSNGGSRVESQQVEEDRSAGEPPIPVREGYRFTGWYLNGEPYNFYSPVTGDITLEAVWEEYAVLAAPSANFPSDSEVEIGTKIVLTCATSGAEIHYTLDGITPDRSSMLYLEPITVVNDITIMAIAVKEGYQDSPVVTFTYHVKESKPDIYFVVFQSNGGNPVENQEVEEGGKVTKPADPVREGHRFIGWYLEDEPYDFESPVTGNLRLDARWEELAVLDMPVANIPSGRAVAEGSKIILSTDQIGVKIYYTLDGTVPTSASLLYRNPIVLSEDTVIRAIAVKNGYIDSLVATFSYTISVKKEELGDILPEDFPEGGLGAVPAGLWIAGVDTNGYTYTGKAIKPEVRVYDYKTLLQPKRDYTVSYKNNTKVHDGSASGQAPSVIVTGKGNYSGKETEIFKILAKDITAKDIVAEDIAVNYNKKVQKVVPALLQNGKKLKNKKDYTVEYPDLLNNSDAYKAPGSYTVLVKGQGGYKGEREISLVITEAKLMSKVSVSKIAAQPYTGSAVTAAAMSAVPVVKSGGTVLREGVHYTASYEDNVEIGTATMILTGTGKETLEGTYTGKKKVTFKITGIDIKKAVVTGIPKSMVYTGSEITQGVSAWRDRIRLTVTQKDQEIKELTEGVDYIVEYQNNITPGTAGILFTGINGCSGMLKKSFKITAYDIQKDSEGLLNAVIEGQPVYAKGGSRPEPVVRFGNSMLEKGKDYTLSYKNNTAINDGTDARKAPVVIVKGKGSFKGSRSLSYTIVKQDIEKLKVTAPDKVYQNKTNAYRSVPKVTDLDGKILKAGKDYDKNYTYSYGEETRLEDGSVRLEGESIGKDDILPANTLVNITVTGTGNYSGTLAGQYRVVVSDISKAKITIPAQTYTGNEITLDKNQISVKIGKDTLFPENYEIIEDSYKNNVRKGTASVMIKGVGSYGGTKTIKFKIKAKSMLWWRRS